MEELWKPITCLQYQSLMTTKYEASNLGHIRNARTRRLVQPHKHNTGYETFNYRYKDAEGKTRFSTMLWHRVIARTWIDNPNDKPQVDHIDRNIHNNAVENLRWVSAKENSENTSPKSKIRYSRYSPTKVLDREGNVIAEYSTLIEACAAYGVSIAHAFEMMHERRPPKQWGTFMQEPTIR